MSRNFASPHTDRDSLYAPLRQADELPGHVITEELAELHNAAFWRGCCGESCRQGRAPCTDRCGAEMGSGEDDPYPGFWRALLAFLTARRPY